MKADIVIGAQYGDEAKGKIAHHLCKTGGYPHCKIVRETIGTMEKMIYDGV